MSVNDPVKRNEFAPPPPDDRDAIKVILAAGAFFAFVIGCLTADAASGIVGLFQ